MAFLGIAIVRSAHASGSNAIPEPAIASE